MIQQKVFNSIHIDLKKGIFELNGEEMKFVKGLELKNEDSHWYLIVSKDEFYVGTEGQKTWD